MWSVLKRVPDARSVLMYLFIYPFSLTGSLELYASVTYFSLSSYNIVYKRLRRLECEHNIWGAKLHLMIYGMLGCLSYCGNIWCKILTDLCRLWEQGLSLIYPLWLGPGVRSSPSSLYPLPSAGPTDNTTISLHRLPGGGPGGSGSAIHTYRITD